MHRATTGSMSRGDARGRSTYSDSSSPLVRILRGFSLLLPGDWLKTTFFLYCIELPRRMLRDALLSFYRFDHVYAVLREIAAGYRGRFSILEFGTSDGY